MNDMVDADTEPGSGGPGTGGSAGGGGSAGSVGADASASVDTAAPPAQDAAPALDTAPVRLDAAPDLPRPVVDAGAPDLRAPLPKDAAPLPKDTAPLPKDAAPAPDVAIAVDTAPVLPRDTAPDLTADLSAPPARYMPMKLGATWTYKVTDTQTLFVTMKKITVEAFEDVGGPKAGVKAFRMKTEKGPTDKTVSWQEDLGNMVVRHRELSYKKGTDFVNGDESWVPYRIRVDERPEKLKAGAKWTETFTETATKGAVTETLPKSDDWIVDAVDETVTVPAGTFKCLKLRKVKPADAIGEPDKIFYWARGVGKVKETGGQTEELASYNIPQ